MLNADQFTIINIVMITCVLITFFSVYVPKQRSRSYRVSAVLSLLICALFMAGIAYFKGIMAANHSMLAVWIPLTFLVFGTFAKYKDGRYVVTYFISLLSITSINGLGFIIVDSFFGWQPVAHVSVRCGLMLLVAWLMWYYVKRISLSQQGMEPDGSCLRLILFALCRILCLSQAHHRTAQGIWICSLADSHHILRHCFGHLYHSKSEPGD